MITKQDINILEKTFTTKKEMKAGFDRTDRKFDKMLATMSGKFDELRVDIHELKDKYFQLNDNLLATKSDLMGEMKAIREEQMVGGYRQSQHSDQLEDHETRITKLETIS